MTPEERIYAEAFARAIAADLRSHPPNGRVVRVIVRWFDECDPLYFTVHALGTDEQAEIASDDAWYPLEWPNLDRELERTERLRQDLALQGAGEALTAHYEAAEDSDEDEGEWGPSVATVAVVRGLPAALQSAGVPLDDDFAASAAHFEGWGALSVLEDVGGAHVLVALHALGQMPAT